ncbi:hypothetical protein CQ14_34615 [Bradyrhizobium lablabi]|uniref:Uncharacterized protein n=1 Tax=Bradyrhizobium lablabi TaxID=722472 RepID=A0A0R3MHG8_9BRAD|nr:hypothetical protein CQ14_34615 [Bradyrhizobium lablabi]
MNIFRTIARYLFPSEKQLYQWYKRVLPTDPDWLEPLWWIVAAALILALCALILFQVLHTS